MVGAGGSRAALSRQRQHADRRHQIEASTPARCDPEQGAARGHLTEARKPFSVQSPEARAL